MENIYKRIPLGKAADLANQRFGSLVALYRTTNKGTRTMWVCKCDCGIIKPIPAQDLTQGHTTSCGCENRKKASERMLNYNLQQQSIKIGDHFGLLTVIDYEGLRKQASRNRQESWYICQCACGSPPKAIRGNDLHSGAVISCGCMCSYGEHIIRQILNKNHIDYKTEYIFQDLVNPITQHHLRFDFAIFENNQLSYLIEFDGRQHFFGPEAQWSQSSSLEDIQFRDKLKNQYCKMNAITLKRIPFTALSHLSFDDIISDKYNI